MPRYIPSPRKDGAHGAYNATGAIGAIGAAASLGADPGVSSMTGLGMPA